MPGKTYIGPAPARRELPKATIGPARSDYVQPEHERVMTTAALSALAATNPVSAFPMAGKLGHDLALEGTAAFADPSNVAALAGIMTYGASAVRMGANAPLMRKMAARGEPLPKIRRMTGYEPGAFGMGAETRGDATLRPAALFHVQGARGRLQDMGYVHPDLERAYPGISDTDVTIVPDADWATAMARIGADARHVASSTGAAAQGRVFIRGRMAGEGLSEYIARSDRTLVHELQHEAQTRDGLRGPRVHLSRDEYLRDAREVDARASADRLEMTPEQRAAFPRRASQDVAPEDVQQDAKGGDLRQMSNFLATDDVPETIFGYPVVQDESQYTESDIEFFRSHPEAGGFYDLGEGAGEEHGAEKADARPSPTFRDRVIRFLNADADPRVKNESYADTSDYQKRASTLLGSVMAGGFGGAWAVGAGGAASLPLAVAGAGAGAGAVAGGGTAALLSAGAYDMLHPDINDLTTDELRREEYLLTHAGWVFPRWIVSSDGTVGYDDFFFRGRDDQPTGGSPVLADPFENGVGRGYRTKQGGLSMLEQLLAHGPDAAVNGGSGGGGSLGPRMADTFHADVRDPVSGVRMPNTPADWLMRRLETKDERLLRERVDDLARSLYKSRDLRTGAYNPNRLWMAFNMAAWNAYRAKYGDKYYLSDPEQEDEVEYASFDDVGRVQEEVDAARFAGENPYATEGSAIVISKGAGPKKPLTDTGPRVYLPDWFLRKYRWKVPKELISTAGDDGDWTRAMNDRHWVPPANAKASAGPAREPSAPATPSGRPSAERGEPGARGDFDEGGMDDFGEGRPQETVRPIPGSLRKDAVRARRSGLLAGNSDSEDSLYRAFYKGKADEVVDAAMEARAALAGVPAESLSGKHLDGVPIVIPDDSPWVKGRGTLRPVVRPSTAVRLESAARDTSGNYDVAVLPPGSRAYTSMFLYNKDGTAANPIVNLTQRQIDAPWDDVKVHELAHPGNPTANGQIPGPGGTTVSGWHERGGPRGAGAYLEGGRLRRFNYYWDQPHEFTAAYANLKRWAGRLGQELPLDLDQFVQDKFGDILASGKTPHIMVPTDADVEAASDPNSREFMLAHRKAAGKYTPHSDYEALSERVNARIDELGIPKRDAGELLRQYILVRELDPEETLRNLRKSRPDDKRIREKFGTPEQRRELWRYMQDILKNKTFLRAIAGTKGRKRKGATDVA